MASSFHLPVDLVFKTVSKVRHQLLTHLQNTPNQTVLLDLNGVIQCDSAGLALLIEAKRLCNRYNKRLLIQRVPSMIYALADFCGLQSLFEVSEGDSK